MATYFFHIRDADVLMEDPDGSDLADIAAAIAEAKEGARSLIAEKIRLGQVVQPGSIEITSPDGQLLQVVTFREVLHELTGGLR